MSVDRIYQTEYAFTQNWKKGKHRFANFKVWTKVLNEHWSLEFYS